MNPFINSLDRLRLQTKLLLAIGAGLGVTLVIGLVSITSIRTLSELTQQTYDQELLGVAGVLQAKAHLTMMGRDLRWMAMSSAEKTRAAGKISVVDAERALQLQISEARTRIVSAQGKIALAKFTEVFPAYSTCVAKTIALLGQHTTATDREAIEFLGSDDYNTAILAADYALDAITASAKESARLSAQRSAALATRAQWLSSALLGFGLLASIALGLLISRSIRQPLNDLQQSVEDMAHGRLDGVVPHTGMANEIGAMADALGILQKGAQAQARASWVKAQSAELLSGLQGIDDMAEFSRRLMARLTTMISAQVGVFYYRSPGTERYSLLGSHAYLHRKGMPQQFAVGEGLVGQCVVEHAPITVSELDDDYIQIASGMGKTAPRFLLVAPLISAAGEIPAVVEFAALSHLGLRERALLDEVLPMLALSISIIERNAKTLALLDASQRQHSAQALPSHEMQLSAESPRDQTTAGPAHG